MHQLGIDAERAQHALESAGGVVRRVTGQEPPPI
jgi:hypothetical protein